MMADPESKRDNSASIQIILAIISLLGVVAVAVISNWNKIFPAHSPRPPNSSVTAAPASSGPIHSKGRQLVNQLSGKCMDVAGGSTADHARVQQFHCQNGTNQIWIFDAKGQIVSLSSDKCLDVPNGSMADHILLQQYTCDGGTNQLWRATPRGEIINLNSGKCVDLPNGNVADQVQLQQFSCNNGSNQEWVFR
jgi:arabinan endo-1,5-alpha-L-arabinosidase